jgi:4-alpha-glucanotransferase
MRLTFQVRFHTHPGQSLLLMGAHEFFGESRVEAALPLTYLDDQTWQVIVLIPRAALPDAPLTYHYVLRNADGSVIHDWGDDRMLNLARLHADEVLVIDAWNNPGFYENAFYTEPFREVLLKSSFTETRVPMPETVTHVFKVKAPLLAGGQTLCLSGNTATLGNWNTSAPVLLSRLPGEDFLTAHMDLSREPFPLAYKYGVYDLERRAFVRYEDGSNRMLHDTVGARKQTIVNDGFAVLPSTSWKGAGVSVPVFSLRSEQSLGIGEFLDLKPLADWCAQTGLKLIQILPVNDTTATNTGADSYPYSAVSAFALHPIYLNLARAASGASKELLAELETERQRLNALEQLHYEAVLKVKLGFLRELYPRQKAALFKSPEYRRFFEANDHWLMPYAVFSHLRDTCGTADFNQWPEHRDYDPEAIRQLASPDSPKYDAVAFYYFVQFHLHLQLREATEYARGRGVILKGDIPIGVCRNGCDAWQHRELLHLEVQAGAPPDPFSAKGQNWSFPTYDWSRMKEDGYAWWKQRLEQMGAYFDAFRIDHILGFFRIWSIPLHAVEGILGYFVPALPVHVSEFTGRGISFERRRFVEPFTTEAVLAELFGEERELVKARFLRPDRFGNYELKPEFGTQRQVEEHFAALESSPANERIKLGLYDLISNVLLFEVPGSQGQQYHFRFGIESTPSFKNLDPHTQAQLRELYVDYFYRRQESFWMKNAMEKLPALKRTTNMLVCGEDLGMVPACVPETMQQLGLLSLEVQRMPKRLGQEFSRPKDAAYLSVVTPSTHDMSTIRGWWEEDRSVTQKFFNQEMGLPGTAPEQCEPWLNEAIVVQHLASPAMWSIFQLQDLLGMDGQLRRKNPAEERINVPANPKHYWGYRMHLTLEELARAEGFNHGLKTLVAQNGRCAGT